MAGGLFSMEHPWASAFGILGTLLPVCAPPMLNCLPYDTTRKHGSIISFLMLLISVVYTG
jgi:hypothetical protein